MKNLFCVDVNTYDKVIVKTLDGKEYDYKDFSSIEILYNEDFVFIKTDDIVKAYSKNNVQSVSLVKLNSLIDINYPDC